MSGHRIGILCPTPEYEEDWSHVRADYTRLLGDSAIFIDWTKADDFGAFDLVTPLLAWGRGIAHVGLVCWTDWRPKMCRSATLSAY